MTVRLYANPDKPRASRRRQPKVVTFSHDWPLPEADGAVNLVSLLWAEYVAYILRIPPMSTLTDDPERQPLLPSTQQSVESSQTTENVTTTVTNDDPLPIYADTNKPDPEERAHLSTILWYTALVAAGILALVFFIKGFIDAGDVDVSVIQYLSLDPV